MNFDEYYHNEDKRKVIFDGGCLIISEDLYSDYFIESAQSDFDLLRKALMFTNLLSSSIKDSKISNMEYDEDCAYMKGMVMGIAVKLVNIATVKVSYDVKTFILTIPAPDIDLNSFPKIKSYLLSFIKNKKSMIVHEFVRVMDYINYNIPTDGKFYEYGSTEYFNSEGEINAYFIGMFHNFLSILHQDSNIRSSFAASPVNDRFEYMMNALNLLYNDVFKNLRPEYKKRISKRFYRIFDEYFKGKLKGDVEL